MTFSGELAYRLGRIIVMVLVTAVAVLLSKWVARRFFPEEQHLATGVGILLVAGLGVILWHALEDRISKTDTHTLNDGERCSFCGAGRQDVWRLIEAPNGVCICNDCVETSSAKLADRAGRAPGARTKPCSFCGERSPAPTRYMAGSKSGVGVCARCVEGMHSALRVERVEVEQRCSFCDASRQDVWRLIEAPGGVCICNDCVEAASAKLANDDEGAPGSRAGDCSFCGKQSSASTGYVAGPKDGLGVCAGCVGEMQSALSAEDVGG